IHFFSTIVFDPIAIGVYSRSNRAFVGEIDLHVPNVSNPTQWQTFETNGFVVTATNYGLTTIFKQAPDLTFGTESPCYVLTHTASDAATNYIFLVVGGGRFADQS